MRFFAAVALASLVSPHSAHSQIPIQRQEWRGIALRDWPARLMSDTTSVRNEARMVLERFGHTSNEVLSALIVFSRDARPHIRARAIWSLGDIRRNEALPVVLLAAKDAEPSVRSEAADAICQVPRSGATDLQSVVETLRRLTTDSTQSVRITATDNLGCIGSAALPLLRRLLRSPDREIQESALFALGNIGREAREMISLITPFVSDTGIDLAQAALRALNQIVRRPLRVESRAVSSWEMSDTASAREIRSLIEAVRVRRSFSLHAGDDSDGSIERFFIDSIGGVLVRADGLFQPMHGWDPRLARLFGSLVEEYDEVNVAVMGSQAIASWLATNVSLDGQRTARRVVRFLTRTSQGWRIVGGTNIPYGPSLIF